MRATFWLLEAPDSLAQQSRSNPDGYGIASYRPDGSAEVDKRPSEAYGDERFAREAKELESPTFLAHVRYASTGGLTIDNTHPFEQRGRVFAHNGHVGDLPALESRLGGYSSLVKGETDSERLFALITREIDANDGDICRGIEAAIGWVAEQLPVYALNLILATDTELWALRYPDTHPLMILERAAGGSSGSRHLDAAASRGTIRVRSGALRARAATIIASEQMDESPGWRMLAPGELVRIDEDLQLTSQIAFADPPAHQLRLEDLHPGAAASQQN